MRLPTAAERLAARRPAARLAANRPAERIAARRFAPRVARAASTTPLAVAPPSMWGRVRNSAFMANHGKKVAAGVVLAGGLHAGSQRSGRGLDKTRGVPRGMFRY